MALKLCPVSLKEANAFVEEHHRHHHAVTAHKFSIGCTDGEKLVGVAIVGRPVAIALDDGYTLEVNRLCTDGTKNACSMLYSAAWNAAKAMGYTHIITYILETESGASLRAAGWEFEMYSRGGARSKDRGKSQEEIKYPICPKKRYGKRIKEGGQ